MKFILQKITIFICFILTHQPIAAMEEYSIKNPLVENLSLNNQENTEKSCNQEKQAEIVQVLPEFYTFKLPEQTFRVNSEEFQEINSGFSVMIVISDLKYLSSTLSDTQNIIQFSEKNIKKFVVPQENPSLKKIEQNVHSAILDESEKNIKRYIIPKENPSLKKKKQNIHSTILNEFELRSGPIDEEILKSLASPDFPKYKKLSLHTCGLGSGEDKYAYLHNYSPQPNFTPLLKDVLLYQTELKSLCLAGNSLNDDDIDILKDSLSGLKKLTYLTFYMNRITDKGAEILKDILLSLPNLIHFNIKANDLTGKGITILSGCGIKDVHF